MRLTLPIVIIFWLMMAGVAQANNLQDSMLRDQRVLSQSALYSLHERGISLQMADARYIIEFDTPQQLLEAALGKGKVMANIESFFYILSPVYYPHLGLMLFYHNKHLVQVAISAATTASGLISMPVIHLQERRLQLGQSFSKAMHQLASSSDAILPLNRLVFGSNYVWLDADDNDTMVQLHYASSFFRAFWQSSRHNFVDVTFFNDGLQINQLGVLRFGMELEQVQLLLGEASAHARVAGSPANELLIYTQFASRLLFSHGKLVGWYSLPAQPNLTLPVLRFHQQGFPSFALNDAQLLTKPASILMHRPSS